MIRQGKQRLTVQIVQQRTTESVLLLVSANDHSPVVGVSMPRLTTKELAVLHWIKEGKRNAEIAVILEMSSRTVEKHIENIFQKLGVETRTAAVRQARENGDLLHV